MFIVETLEPILMLTSLDELDRREAYENLLV